MATYDEVTRIDRIASDVADGVEALDALGLLDEVTALLGTAWTNP